MNNNFWTRNNNTNQRNQQTPSSKYTLQMESVPFDKFHFYLPKIPPTWKLSPIIKEAYFRKTLEGVRSVHTAPPDCHLRLMETRFPFQHLKQEVQRSLQDLYDTKLTMSTQHGNIKMTNRKAFTLSRPKLLNAEGKIIPLPDPPNQAVTLGIRQRARFYSFNVSIDAMAAFTGNPSIRSKVSNIPMEREVAINIPSVKEAYSRVPTVSMIWNASNMVDLMHPQLTSEILRDPTQFIHQVEIINGFYPSIGILIRTAGSLHTHVDNGTFFKQFISYYERTVLDIFIPMLQEEFMAGASTDIGSLTEHITSKRQQFIDPTTRKVQSLSVDEYYQDFTNTLSILQGEPTYHFDIAQTFWQGLARDVKEKARAHKYTPPPPTTNETKQQAENRLRKVKEQAIIFEGETLAIKNIVNRANQRQHIQSTSSMAWPISDHFHSTDDLTLYDPDMIPQQSPTFSSLNDSFHSSPQDQADEYFLQCTICASMAEQALVKASNTQQPLACWGCGSFEHLWSNCPLRSQPAARAKARQAMTDLFNNRSKNRQPPTPQSQPISPNQQANPSQLSPTTPFATRAAALISNWESEGHPSQQVAESIAHIYDPNTQKANRTAIYMSLQNNILQASSQPKRSLDHPSNPPSKTPKTTFALMVIPTNPYKNKPAKMASNIPAATTNSPFPSYHSQRITRSQYKKLQSNTTSIAQKPFLTFQELNQKSTPPLLPPLPSQPKSLPSQPKSFPNKRSSTQSGFPNPRKSRPCKKPRQTKITSYLDKTSAPHTPKNNLKSPPTIISTKTRFNTYPYKLAPGTYKIECLSKNTLNHIPKYQHVSLLPRTTSQHKLPFQNQLTDEPLFNAQLPDLSDDGISEENLIFDPVIAPPQLQAAHTLHQLPKISHGGIPPSIQKEPVHNFLQDKLDKTQSDTLNKLTTGETFHNHLPHHNSPPRISQCHSTLSSYHRSDPIQQDWVYIDDNKILSSHILPPHIQPTSNVASHQATIFNTPHQQPQILSITTSKPSRPTALPLQPEHLNRKFPPYTQRHPPNPQVQPQLPPATNATEPYYTAEPSLQQLLHIGPIQHSTNSTASSTPSTSSNNSVVSKPSSYTSAPLSPPSEEQQKAAEDWEEEFQSLLNQIQITEQRDQEQLNRKLAKERSKNCPLKRYKPQFKTIMYTDPDTGETYYKQDPEQVATKLQEMREECRQFAINHPLAFLDDMIARKGPDSPDTSGSFSSSTNSAGRKRLLSSDSNGTISSKEDSVYNKSDSDKQHVKAVEKQCIEFEQWKKQHILQQKREMEESQKRRREDIFGNNRPYTRNRLTYPHLIPSKISNDDTSLRTPSPPPFAEQAQHTPTPIQLPTRITSMSTSHSTINEPDTSTSLDNDSIALPVLVANATFRSPSLPLSETMPHIQFPIGTGEPHNDATLCAMIDSGAGCNLGRKSYHLSIYEKFPKLVLAVESEVNQAEWQNINIGHIDADGQPVVISAVIVYKTPYEIDGHPVSIRVGLADKTAINTIFGITFLRSCESVVFFGGSTRNKDQLVSSRLGITLPIHMQPPTYTDDAPNYDPRSSAAFHTTNNTPIAAPGFLVSSDTTAMIGPHIAEQPPEDGDDFLICQLN